MMQFRNSVPSAGVTSAAGELGQGQKQCRRAVIDIGSNSVRLVIFNGPARAPVLLFNEKVAAGLGAELTDTGRIGEVAMQRGLDALGRFALLAQAMEVGEIHCIATAAVRDASNGADFVARAQALTGMTIELLPGEEEGRASGFGVISSIQEANGIVADLGGGSLELARVRDGEVHEVVSLPLGVLRLGALRAKGQSALSKYLARTLKGAGWTAVTAGLPLYLVGGSWRALAHLDMQLTRFPLPVIHQYCMAAERAAHLVRVAASMGKARLAKVPAISSTRAATLPDAAVLLAALVRQLGSSELIVSAHGLREGLLFQRLNEADRARDPLLVAAEAEGAAQGRFPDHGGLIAGWIAALFESDSPEWTRIRHAACLLGDVAWRASPDFRAERGMEIALHGNWIGIDGWGRAMLAQALYSNFGGGGMVQDLTVLASREQLTRAIQWGLAIRLAQRLSGGVASPLKATRLGRSSRGIELVFAASHAALAGEAVSRRLRNLAQAMSLEWRIATSA